MNRSRLRACGRKLPTAILASAFALALLLISGLFGPAAYAQQEPVLDVRTWEDPNGGPSFTFASYGIWQSCSTRGDRITTTGMRPGWRLEGAVNVRLPLAAVPLYTIPVAQTGDLDLLVPYPPVSQWQDNGSNFEIHVDLAISVYDENDELVQWVGGGLPETPGVLGPNQDWDVFCGTPLTPDIDIIKLTNGADANAPDAAGVPVVAPGDPVVWTYLITNTGPVDIPLAEITVTDNIPGVSPLFDAVVSGDGKGDGNGILQPGEVWRYSASGVAVDLTNPPAGQGLVLVPNVCRGGNANVPGRTAYTNIGTVQIPNTSATDPSSYCNPLISLSVSKTAVAAHTVTRTWEITKRVAPAVVSLLEGEDADVSYTVQVTPTTGAELFAVSGTIALTNTGQAATVVSAVVDTISGGGAGAGVVPVSCPGGLPQSLNPGATLLCTYASSLADDSTRTNSVVVTHNGASQASATAQIVFGPPTVVNNAVTVDDAYNGGSAVVLLAGITSPTSIPYTRNVVCGSDLNYQNGVATFTRANIARIVETNQTDDAIMRVNCTRPTDPTGLPPSDEPGTPRSNTVVFLPAILRP